MALYTVQTTINPGVNIEVDDAELERLTELGLLVNGPAVVTAGALDDLDARYAKGTGIREVRLLTQAQYDAIGTKITTTMYVIQG